MKASKSLVIAESYRKDMQRNLDAVNKKLIKLLGDDNASVFYQSSDGWCILFDGECNAPLDAIDIDELLAMDKDEVLDYLRRRQI